MKIISGSIFFLILFNLIAVSLQDGYFLQEKYLNEERAREIARRFRPILRFEENEKYWPAAIEWFGINWTQAEMNNTNATVSYNYTGPLELNSTAPVYVSVLENPNGTLRISYAYLYAYNGCGPQLDVNINTNFGFNINNNFSICPLGLHWGDIERVTLFISRNYNKVTGLEIAFHDDSILVNPSEVTFKGNRPVIYIAPGSHASYHTKGQKEIMHLWNVTARTFSTSGNVVETVSGNGKTWKDYDIRLLKFNGNSTSDISYDEYNLAFNFTGRLGTNMTNFNFDFFVHEILLYAENLKYISLDAYNLVRGGIFMLSQNIHKNACPTLAGPGRQSWW